MSKENPWEGVTFDLYHITRHAIPEVFEVKLRTLKMKEGELGSSTELTIKNLGKSTMEFKFDWWNITEKQREKIRTVKVGERKRAVVPPGRRVTLIWRFVTEQ